MKITFLGTGTSTGVPILANNHPVCLSKDSKDKRLRSSILISWNDANYIIDCGPDFRQQMLRENVQSISGILFTHEHSDHVAGFDDIRPYSFKMGEVPIYATQRVVDNLKKRYDYIFATQNRYDNAPSVKINIIDNNPFILNRLEVIPIEVMHGKLPIMAFRFQNFAYVTDVKLVSKKESKKLKNLDILVVDAVRIKEHPTHFNLKEALQFIDDIKPKIAYLTHISHQLGFHTEVEKQLPKNVFLAYDGLKIKV